MRTTAVDQHMQEANEFSAQALHEIKASKDTKLNDDTRAMHLTRGMIYAELSNASATLALTEVSRAQPS